MTKPNLEIANLDAIQTMHSLTLEMDGGLRGIRDQGALESAIARGQNRSHYNPQADIFELVAAVGYALIQNHPFNDGNKRTGTLFTLTCLDQNNYKLPLSDKQLHVFFQSIAAGTITEEKMALFLRTHALQKTPEKSKIIGNMMQKNGEGR